VNISLILSERKFILAEADNPLTGKVQSKRFVSAKAEADIPLTGKVSILLIAGISLIGKVQ
jgi:hypothetical protein